MVEKEEQTCDDLSLESCDTPAIQLMSVLNEAAFKQGLHVNLFIERTKRDTILSDIDELNEQINLIQKKIELKKSKLSSIEDKILSLNENIMKC